MDRRTLVAVAAVVLVSQAAMADIDALGERILACSGEADDSRRLACYDREAGTLSAPDETVSAAAGAAQPGVADTENASDAAGASADDFGMNRDLARSKGVLEAEDKVREISATVVEVAKPGRRELVVTLDNGQIWIEKSATMGFRVRVGDTVIIRQGSFSGAYRMHNRGRSSQVRRVK